MFMAAAGPAMHVVDAGEDAAGEAELPIFGQKNLPLASWIGNMSGGALSETDAEMVHATGLIVNNADIRRDAVNVSMSLAPDTGARKDNITKRDAKITRRIPTYEWLAELAPDVHKVRRARRSICWSRIPCSFHGRSRSESHCRNKSLDILLTQ